MPLASRRRERQGFFERGCRFGGLMRRGRVPIGLHSGAARRIAESYKGRGVHQAARIAALAEPDEILASVTTLDGPAAAGARTVRLKGINEPVLVAPVDWR